MNKILFVTNSLDTGGAENILFNLLKRSNKIEPFIIVLTSLGKYGKELKDNGYKVVDLNIKKDILSLFKILYLLFLIIKIKPIIVHTWLYHSNFLGGILAKIAGVKKIYWSIHHDYEYSNIFTRVEMKLLAFLSYLIPNKIIYSSESSKKNHIMNGYRNVNTKIIENGVSLKEFKNNNLTKEKLRQEFNIEDECLILGNISRYHPLKDHDNLLKSLRILLKYDVNFKCILIGSGLNYSNIELQEKIKKFNLKDKVLLYGESNNVSDMFNLFDLNILSSKSECFPLTLLESMASSVPSISTDVGDAKQIIGSTGWIVEPSNPHAIADCILNIENKRDILIKKGKLARNRVRQFYSLEKMILSYYELYETRLKIKF